MAISYPPILLNEYLRDKLGTMLNITAPFFPTSPSTLEQLTQTATINNSGNLFAVYDRMFKMRRKPFPHIKSEQLLYYFYSLDIEAMLDATQIVADLLDRGDESAQDVNEWVRLRLVTSPNSGEQVFINNGKEFLPVFFHEIKIYQLEETRDIVDFGTARTYAGNKLILDYTYHTTGYPNRRNEDGSYTGLGNTSYNGTSI
jgi:hypothetical protein